MQGLVPLCFDPFPFQGGEHPQLKQQPFKEVNIHSWLKNAMKNVCSVPNTVMLLRGETAQCHRKGRAL